MQFFRNIQIITLILPLQMTFGKLLQHFRKVKSQYFKFREFPTLHFQQRTFSTAQPIKRIILIYHAARRCISLMPQAATNGIEWLHSAFVFIRCTFRCIVHCINSSYSEYWLRRAKGSLLKKASETSMNKILRYKVSDNIQEKRQNW